jgi:hypothetical protein
MTDFDAYELAKALIQAECSEPRKLRDCLKRLVDAHEELVYERITERGRGSHYGFSYEKLTTRLGQHVWVIERGSHVLHTAPTPKACIQWIDAQKKLDQIR